VYEMQSRSRIKAHYDQSLRMMVVEGYTDWETITPFVHQKVELAPYRYDYRADAENMLKRLCPLLTEDCKQVVEVR